MSDYNGWKNHETWNVSLWINNDPAFYEESVEFMKDYKGEEPYKDFCYDSGLSTQKTPDSVSWLSDLLDYKALDEMMREQE